MGPADIEDIAREVARSSVYRVERVYKLVRSEFKETGKKKKILGVNCNEHSVYLQYKISEVEKGYLSTGRSHPLNVNISRSKSIKVLSGRIR